jgi:SsrA-binding protein
MTTFLKNKKATFNYEVLDKFEAGIVLHGFEVKSLKTARGGSLDGSHVSIRGGEAFLLGAHIPPYQPGNTQKDYDSRRPRKLLLKAKELNELIGIAKTKGLTLIPLSMYNAGRNVKVSLAVVRGKKKYDKREAIKKRDVERDIAREYKVR